jgi:tetratricopeptide (TPR) repeat protein
MATPAHAFVAMPFGRKPGPDGAEVDFNRVYRELIAPAIRTAGLSAFRADQEPAAGSILADMFQELLIADLVVADLTIPNPNVWYEIGVRHALRARGVVLIFGGKAPSAFDLYTERKLRYGLAGDGPDPATLAGDVEALAKMIRATMAAWHKEKISPVYSFLPQLQEPDWKTLRVGQVQQFWEQHDAWERRIDLARQTGQIGDLLVLADEGPVAAFRADAWELAGTALRKAGRSRLALDVLSKCLALEPGRLAARRELGICLQRLARDGAPGHSLARARQHYETLLADHPRDIETWALLGRIEKDAWVAAWRRPGAEAKAMFDDAAYEDALLKAAITAYGRAFRSDPGHCFSGINTLTLLHLAAHLQVPQDDEHHRQVLGGAVRFAAENDDDPGQRFWAAATLGDLEVLIGAPEAVARAYKAAVAVPGTDWFALNSCREQLLLLKDLGFRPEAVAAGLAVFDRALARLQQPEAAWQPRQVLLFSGHMVDAPNRPSPRFPATAEPLAAKAIGDALDALGAGPDDLAFCQAAAGGDLLFVEACQARGLRCRVLLPFAEAEYVDRSVLPSSGGEGWRDRFHAALVHAGTTLRTMPDELGPLPEGVDPFERCNLWLLYSALACGVKKVRFVTLWNGGGGDGPGGTAHMVAEVRRLTGQVEWLDTREIFKPLLQA